MSLFNATLKAALQARPGRAFLVLNITFPSSLGLQKWSAISYNSKSGGSYLPRIKTWDKIRRTVIDRGNELAISPTTLRVIDKGRTLERLLEGAQGNQARGSAAVIILAHRDVAPANWEPVKAAVLKTWPRREPGTYDLVLVEDVVTALHSERLPPITAADWPNASEEALRCCAMFILGKHDSSAQGVKGMVQLLCVDQILHQYGPIMNRLTALTRVWVGDREALASEYTEVEVDRSGRRYTLVQFNSNPSPDGKPVVVKIDCEGADTLGTGAGTLVSNPADQFELAVINLVLLDYMGGSFVTSHSKLNAASIDAVATYFSNHGTVGAYVWGGTEGRPRGIDLVRDFVRSVEAKVTFSVDGELMLKLDDPGTASWSSAPVWKVTRHAQSGRGVRTPHNDDALKTRLSLEYSGGRQKQLVANSSIVSDDANDTLQQVWSAHHVVS